MTFFYFSHCVMQIKLGQPANYPTQTRPAPTQARLFVKRVWVWSRKLTR
jgi:hypothetical protein